jgi:hypothetical protein
VAALLLHLAMAAVLQATGGAVAAAAVRMEVTEVEGIHPAVAVGIHPAVAAVGIRPVVAGTRLVVVAVAIHPAVALAIPAVDIANHGEGISRSISRESVEWL